MARQSWLAASNVAQRYCETVAPANPSYHTAFRVMVILALEKQVALMPGVAHRELRISRTIRDIEVHSRAW